MSDILGTSIVVAPTELNSLIFSPPDGSTEVAPKIILRGNIYFEGVVELAHANGRSGADPSPNRYLYLKLLCYLSFHVQL